MSNQEQRYTRLQRIKTLGFHDFLMRFSSPYKLYFLAGLHAVSINHGANINKEVSSLKSAFDRLDTEKAATAIIFHPKFGKTRNKKG
ncbi:conserved hypothetical protein [Vibrio nigripulchritudo SOn1]|uniref:Uncharacterized protein n=1 Tax=Vibrio nigripulchritudo SOn1 TaxID=1238450 RepID=A0AAV2VQ47_9VIBR|nr:hypothetical protein [Vibrio nigripulchritudo]CCO46672.1 conserved hypothetical protein [Vibrio nigripulchritudo SOn1]